jgi:hypothetical protein
MANRRVNIEKGQIFNRLTVIEMIGKSNQGHIIYNCKCICGNIKAVIGSSLKRGTQQSCGCLRLENSAKLGKSRQGKSHLDKGESGLNQLYSQYRLGAKYRQLEFNLTKDDFSELSKKNCAYCGQTPTQVMNKISENGKYIYNGIDRVDNKLGYSIDNCVPCCKICNRAKDVMSVDDFYNWIKQVFETRFK